MQTAHILWLEILLKGDHPLWNKSLNRALKIAYKLIPKCHKTLRLRTHGAFPRNLKRPCIVTFDFEMSQSDPPTFVSGNGSCPSRAVQSAARLAVVSYSRRK